MAFSDSEQEAVIIKVRDVRLQDPDVHRAWI
jgi:hypothetical protein